MRKLLSQPSGQQGEEPGDKFKAWWLWIWAKEAGLGLSRDEAAEMLHTGSWSPEVKALWERKSAQQKRVEAICSAAATGDEAALKVRGHCMHACVLPGSTALSAELNDACSCCILHLTPQLLSTSLRRAQL